MAESGGNSASPAENLFVFLTDFFVIPRGTPISAGSATLATGSMRLTVGGSGAPGHVWTSTWRENQAPDMGKKDRRRERGREREREWRWEGEGEDESSGIYLPHDDKSRVLI